MSCDVARIRSKNDFLIVFFFRLKFSSGCISEGGHLFAR